MKSGAFPTLRGIQPVISTMRPTREGPPAPGDSGCNACSSALTMPCVARAMCSSCSATLQVETFSAR